MCTQYDFHTLIALFLTTFFFACDREDIYQITDTPIEGPPVEIEYQQGFAYQTLDDNVILEEGSAKRIGADESFSMVITTGTISCDGGSVYSVQYSGSNFFIIEFYQFDGVNYPTRASITTEVDGQTMTLESFIPAGSGCDQADPVLTISEFTEDHIAGTYTADFFRFGEVMNDTLPCFGFVYVGEFTAEFSLPYDTCE